MQGCRTVGFTRPRSNLGIKRVSFFGFKGNILEPPTLNKETGPTPGSSSGLRAKGLGFRVQGSGFRVQGFRGSGVQGWFRGLGV